MTAIGTPKFEALPDALPVFPLEGVLLLPQGQLPLHIFEPRYLAMVDDVLKTHRLIGMIQPRDNGGLMETGCVGKITHFQELEDARYMMTLTGICRFDVAKEIEPGRGYRRVAANWSAYKNDTQSAGICLDIDREGLLSLLKAYFKKNEMQCEWEMMSVVPNDKLMTALAMICPFDSDEKQALLEAKDCKTRADLFTKLLTMSVYGMSHDNTSFH